MIKLSEQQKKAFDLYVKDALTIKEISLRLGVSYTRAINILNEILIKAGMKSRKELLISGKNLEIE
jgi:DNA-binding CsgD family transcriptional regulator